MSPRVPTLLAACGVLLACAPASAGTQTATTTTQTAATTPAPRFATPGAADGGTCSQAAPCSLKTAVSNAPSGADVTVEPGTYALTTNLDVPAGVTVHGADGQPAPVLAGDPKLGGDAAVATHPGATVRHLAIRSAAPNQSTLKLDDSLGDDLVLSAAGAAAPDDDDDAPAAAVLIGSPAPHSPTVLRDTVAWASGANVDGVFATGESSDSPAAVSLVNVTAAAGGPAGIAVSAVAPSGSVDLTDVIARGAAADLYSASGVLTASHSDFRAAASVGVADQGGNTEGVPLFANPAAGDFHELAGSPTVDAGIVVPLSGATDPDGNPRQLGPAPDIGAFELVPGPGSGPGGTAGGAPGSLTAPLNPAAPGMSGDVLVPPPVAGRTVDVVPSSGTVLVRRPGDSGFSLLAVGEQVPVGSTVDARSGKVRLTSARDVSGTPQTGTFWAGKFRVDQNRGPSPVTLLSLVGPLTGCRSSSSTKVAHGVPYTGLSHLTATAASRALATAARRHSHVRQLWGSDTHGHFSTRGNDSLATVRGTVWLTKDRCDGTVTRVLKGQVSVRDLATGKTFLLHAGQRHLARASG